MNGKIIKMENLTDDAFSMGVLGKGLGIEPTDGIVLSPVSGTVTVLFPSLHAIGITSDLGVEILIHIGLDTVQLDGKGFKSFIKQGDIVKQGQKLVTVDLDYVKSKGYSVETPIIITNHADLLDIVLKPQSEVKKGDEFFTVIF